LLLALFAHAFLVSVTHCHRFVRAGGPGAEYSVGVGDREDSSRPAEFGGEAQCLLCRLQRNFVTDFDTVSLPVDAPRQEKQLHSLRPSIPPATRAFCVPPGRAPPLA
jgi:hypothetical protein